MARQDMEKAAKSSTRDTSAPLGARDEDVYSCNMCIGLVLNDSKRGNQLNYFWNLLEPAFYISTAYIYITAIIYVYKKLLLRS